MSCNRSKTPPWTTAREEFALLSLREEGVVVALTSGNFESAPAERGVSAVENYIIPAILAPQ